MSEMEKVPVPNQESGAIEERQGGRWRKRAVTIAVLIVLGIVLGQLVVPVVLKAILL